MDFLMCRCASDISGTLVVHWDYTLFCTRISYIPVYIFLNVLMPRFPFCLFLLVFFPINCCSNQILLFHFFNFHECILLANIRTHSLSESRTHVQSQILQCTCCLFDIDVLISFMLYFRVVFPDDSFSSICFRGTWIETWRL